MFINSQQLKQLREAAKNGDTKAKKIISLQLSNKDFSNELNDYFKEPEPEPELTGLDKFLADNNIQKGSSDYDEAVEMYNQENGVQEPTWQSNVEQLISNVTSSIQGYDMIILALANDTSMSDSSRKGVIQTIQQIKDDCLRHISDLQKITSDIEKDNQQI